MLDKHSASYTYKADGNARRSNNAIVETNDTGRVVSRYFKQQQTRSNDAIDSTENIESRHNNAECSERKISRYFQRKKQRPKNKSTPPSSSSSTLLKRTSPKCYVVEIDGVEKVVSPYFNIPKGANLICETELVRQKRPNDKRKRSKMLCEEDKDEDVDNGKRKRKRKQRSQLTAAEKKLDAYRRVTEEHMFRPPYSCHHLLQERHCYDPWRVLVISMLLNVTTGGQVAKVLSEFFSLCPDAETTTKVQVQDIENVISSLGLQHARAVLIKRFSSEYLKEDWTHVTQLHGVGKYAADAYATFCTGELEGVRPQDHKLVDYWKFVYPEKLAD